MHVITAQNVQDALYQGMSYLARHGVERDSRNGPVLLSPQPVTTLYANPRERVLFWPARDANPFFHLFESLWMLGGRRDVKSVTHYVRRMRDFSDNGETFYGAYGWRWRWQFGHDQIPVIIDRLRSNPDDRRSVLAMWSAMDLGHETKDLPCNTHVYLTRDLDGRLDMTVCCRSNDVIWGAYGANAVHFSMLQEYMAAGIGCEVGHYWQMSNNYHAYRSTFDPLREARREEQRDPMNRQRQRRYGDGDDIEPYPLVSIPLEDWDVELHGFLAGGSHHFRDPFFRHVAVPVRSAYNLFREGRLPDAINECRAVAANDWRVACREWLDRRLQRRMEKS